MHRREHRYQLFLADFFLPFDGKLSGGNRWRLSCWASVLFRQIMKNYFLILKERLAQSISKLRNAISD